jgi:hypothetical protein
MFSYCRFRVVVVVSGAAAAQLSISTFPCSDTNLPIYVINSNGTLFGYYVLCVHFNCVSTQATTHQASASRTAESIDSDVIILFVGGTGLAPTTSSTVEG